MTFNPERVFNAYKNKLMDKNSAVELLKAIIENKSEEILRIECIEVIQKIGIKSLDIFKFLENLMISDLNPSIRLAAFETMKKNYRTKAIAPVIHAIKKENGFFLIQLIEFLSEINPFLCRKFLIEKIKEIKENIDSDIYFNDHIEKVNFRQLKEILNNYLFKKSWEKLYFHTRRDSKL